MKIFDFHNHIFPQKIADKAVDNIGGYYDIKMQCKGTADDLLKDIEGTGICKCVIHSTATKVEQVEVINSFVAGVVDEYPDIMYGFGTLHPEFEQNGQELERIQKIGLRGLKFHPDFQLFNIDDPKMFEIYDMVGDKLPILLHTGDENFDRSSPTRMAHAAREFKNVIFIAAHLGGYQRWDESLEVLAGMENVYFDTCSSVRFIPPEKSMELIHKHGVERVLFGTDYPMAGHHDELTYIDKLPLTVYEKERILWDNAAALMAKFE